MVPSPFAAQLLNASASGYAGFAASLLLERRPEVAERFAPTAMATWKDFLTQQVQELAAAVAAGEERLFVSKVLWAWEGFRTREVPDDDFRESFRCLREILDDELPELAKEQPLEMLELALEALAQAPPEPPKPLDSQEPRQRLALQYLEAVLEGDGRRAIRGILEAVDQGLPLKAAYLEVLIPAQREIGRLWHAGEVRIAEEHFATVTARRLMANLAERAEIQASNSKTVIAASVAGNIHDLGVRVIADFFEMAGWKSICLGADVPRTEVVDAVHHFDADLLVLSAALATHLDRVRETIAALGSKSERRPKVLVGGIAFEAVADLWRALGADGYTPTADAAVELGARLVGVE